MYYTQTNINITKWNYKAQGPDESHGFWLKKIHQSNFTSIHQAMKKHLDHCIKTGDVPKWTVLIQKKMQEREMLLAVTDK